MTSSNPACLLALPPCLASPVLWQHHQDQVPNSSIAINVIHATSIFIIGLILFCDSYEAGPAYVLDFNMVVGCWAFNKLQCSGADYSVLVQIWFAIPERANPKPIKPFPAEPGLSLRRLLSHGPWSNNSKGLWIFPFCTNWDFLLTIPMGCFGSQLLV